MRTRAVTRAGHEERAGSSRRIPYLKDMEVTTWGIRLGKELESRGAVGGGILETLK